MGRVYGMNVGIKIAILCFILPFWGAMTTLLVRKDILPYLDYEEAPSYRQFLSSRKKTEIMTMRLIRGGEEAGTIRTTVTPKSDGSYVIATISDLRLMVPGSGDSISVYMDSKTLIDPLFKFHRFEIDIKTRVMVPMEISARGERRGETIVMTIKTPVGEIERTMEYGEDETISDSLLPLLGASNLSVGKKWKIKTLEYDFLQGTFRQVPLWATVEVKEKRMWEGKEIDVFTVEVKKRLDDEKPAGTLIVGADGTVLSHEMEIGGVIHTVLLEKKEVVEEGIRK